MRKQRRRIIGGGDLGERKDGMSLGWLDVATTFKVGISSCF